MPKGMTPKKRMTKTTMGLARAVKPSGRLNRDDMVNARANRSKMSLSQIKDKKKLGKATKSINDIFNKLKQEPGMVGMPRSPEALKAAIKASGSKMGVAGSMKGIKELMKKISDVKTRQEKTKRPGSRPNTNSKTKTPSSRTSDRRPMGTKALGPIRPIRERSQSKLISRRRSMGKR